MLCSLKVLGKRSSTTKLSWHTKVTNNLGPDAQRVPESNALLPFWYFYWNSSRKLWQKNRIGQHYAVSGGVTSLLNFEGKLLFRDVHFHSREFSAAIICPICAPSGSIIAFRSMSSFIASCISGGGKSLWNHRDSFENEVFFCHWCYIVHLIQWVCLKYCWVTFLFWVSQFYGPNLTACGNSSLVGWQTQLWIKLWVGKSAHHRT